MDEDGSNVKQLTNSPGYDGGPFFNPDGSKIIWRRFNPDGNSAEIWIMDSDGTHQRQLTADAMVSWAPFFHPSGDYFIYSSNVLGHANFELFIMDVDGNGAAVRELIFFLCFLRMVLGLLGARPGRKMVPRNCTLVIGIIKKRLIYLE